MTGLNKNDLLSNSNLIKQFEEKISSIIRNILYNSFSIKNNSEFLKSFSLSTSEPKIELAIDTFLKNDFFSWNQDLIDFSSSKSLKIRLANITDFDLEARDSESKKFYELKQHNNQNLIYLYRANLDLACNYLIFHDFKLHQDQLKESEFLNEEQKIFDDFEKIRIFLLGSKQYLGFSLNILKKISEDFDNFHKVLKNDALLIPTSLIIHSNCNKPHFITSPSFINSINQILKTKFKTFESDIKEISSKLHDQKKFGFLVRKLIKELRSKEKEGQQRDFSKNHASSHKKTQQIAFGAESFESEIKNNEDSDKESGESLLFDKAEQNLANSDFYFSLSENEKEISLPSFRDKNLISSIEFRSNYKVYSKEFDEIINPSKFINKNELLQLRDQLDLKLRNLSKISRKNIARLRRSLISKKDNLDVVNDFCGVLNRKLLSQIIINPKNQAVWQQFQLRETQDTAISVLIDNSGSMRGNPITMSAMVCETIAKIMEEFSIKTEIIGFTTSDWRGGKVRKLWESEGRPINPGRLNQIRHIIYKPFDQSYRKAKINLGLMLKEGILKENIDGEAILFARSRLIQQNATRKIMLVISDGNPVDDSTNSSNKTDILSEHLAFVINKIEKQKAAMGIEVIGIGIGHSTSDFYQNEISIKNIEDLGDAMIAKIAEML